MTNADLDQKLNWSGEQKTLSPPPIPRRASRSLSPSGSPQASSTRRSNIGSDTLSPNKATNNFFYLTIWTVKNSATNFLVIFKLLVSKYEIGGWTFTVFHAGGWTKTEIGWRARWIPAQVTGVPRGPATPSSVGAKTSIEGTVKITDLKYIFVELNLPEITGSTVVHNLCFIYQNNNFGKIFRIDQHVKIDEIYATVIILIIKHRL